MFGLAVIALALVTTLAAGCLDQTFSFVCKTSDHVDSEAVTASECSPFMLENSID